MVININPNRINSNPAGRNAVGRERSNDQKLKSAPRKSEENFIPDPESLSSMIRSAVEALRQGMRWDRGTILNLLA